MKNYVKTFENFINDREDKPYKEYTPDFYIAKVDETSYWSEDILNKISEYNGKIYGYYLYDKSHVIHAASLEGSYEFHWLYNRIEAPGVDLNEFFSDDELYEIEDNSGEQEIMYVSEHSKYNEVKFNQFSEADLIEATVSEEDYMELEEKAIDYLRGNPKEF